MTRISPTWSSKEIFLKIMLPFLEKEASETFNRQSVGGILNFNRWAVLGKVKNYPPR
jgi:hypothetical protein